MKYFSWKPTRNCRKFHKRHYTLMYTVDEHLTRQLEKFGLIEEYKFSNYSKSALDIFKIKLDDLLEISGAYKSNTLQLTIPRESPELIDEIEHIINNWSIKIEKSKCYSI